MENKDHFISVYFIHLIKPLTVIPSTILFFSSNKVALSNLRLGKISQKFIKQTNKNNGKNLHQTKTASSTKIFIYNKGPYIKYMDDESGRFPKESYNILDLNWWVMKYFWEFFIGHKKCSDVLLSQIL